MLLLMDEVFDLKEKNQWLRRNIKNLLQQLIRATYGDTINRSEAHDALRLLNDQRHKEHHFNPMSFVSEEKLWIMWTT